MADDAGMRICCGVSLCLSIWYCTLAATAAAQVQEPYRPILPEQKCLDIRSPQQMRQAHLPKVEAPTTVATRGKAEKLPSYPMTLDEAIRIALETSEVIRVLGGSSGRTVYDPAIANTQIDSARARFDPSVTIQNRFNGNRYPIAGLDGGAPSGVSIGSDPTHDYEMSMGLSKRGATGGTLGLDVWTNPTTVDTTDPLLLNPESRSLLDMSFTQPLLKGAGRQANLTPIVLARIDTERSFYQLKVSVQNLVQSVIDAYWSLVFARMDVLVRQQQTAQGLWALRRAEAQLAAHIINAAEKAQAQSAWANFRSAQISAEAAVFQREQALRDILGIEPFDGVEIVPVTPPAEQQLTIDWNNTLRLAEQNRCDLIELKLAVESTERQLLLARNTALPQVDATGRYRFNGLEGRAPSGDYLVAHGDFTGWQLGIDVTMPLGLREARADLRARELALARDRSNLHEGLRQATHDLSLALRNLDQYYQVYLAAKDARIAARINYEYQQLEYEVGRTIYLNLLQAITSWGNAVSSESQALLQYNSELANLELQMGTILETHGIRFYEEGFRSMGPMGRFGHEHCYPRSVAPGNNADRYPGGEKPSEGAFHPDDLTAP